MLVAYIIRATENVDQRITEEEYISESNKLENQEMKDVIRPLTNWLSDDEKTAIREEGIKIGEANAERKGIKILRDLVTDKILTPSQAAKRAGLTLRQFEQKVSALA
ncbi:MAG: hypothetical protein IJM30_03415 [Thermoguttaceae bacterium]|nr:hypothetical protein [Thermoguttaceae bacterium]